jgi:hypothetical protein
MPSILIDTSTGIVLSISPYVHPIVAVNECTRDTRHVPSVTYPNYLDRRLFLLDKDPSDLPNWSWNYKTRLFEKTLRELITENTRSRSALAVAQTAAFSSLIYQLNLARQKIGTGLNLQETVYLTKRAQAEAFKASGYDESLAVTIPYVTAYAEYAGISLKQAADEIIFKGSLDDDFLIRTETVRIEYSNRIKAMRSPSELDEIRSELFRMLSGNALS